MGEDKAGLRLGGQTLLERAIATLAAVTEQVTVAGVRGGLPKGVRGIGDGIPGCGPMGGIEASLRDCRERGGEWAVFLPVDMPLLPAGLLGALVPVWLDDAEARVGWAEVEGRAQPLVSAVHVEVLADFEAALGRGEFKLQPALRAAAARLAAEREVGFERVLRSLAVTWEDAGEVRAGGEALGWRPTATEWSLRGQWFANGNTPEEFAVIKRVVGMTDKENRRLVPGADDRIQRETYE